MLETIGASTSAQMAGRFNWSPATPGADDNETTDASAAFDELISNANRAMSPEERNAIFREAEALLIDQAIYVPLGHWVQRFVQKPWLKGTRQGPWSGSIPVRFDDAVLIEGRPGS
jgi:ABC-type transport system substrate-binding protein